MKNTKNYTKLFSIAYLGVLLFWFIAAMQGLYSFEAFNYNETNYHFVPHIGIACGAVLDAMPSFVSQFISVVLIPFAILNLLIKIFSKYVNQKWAVLLSILALSVFANYPFRSFITGAGMEHFNMPTIFQYPFPGISTLLFLILFSLIIEIKKIKLFQVFLYTVLTALFFYINALESVFILGFWFLFFPFRLHKRLQWASGKIAGMVFLQLLIAMGIIALGLKQGSLKVYEEHSYVQQIYLIGFYYVLPILAMLVLYLVKRIDKYEIWVKFRHVYGFMAIEIGIVLFSFLGIIPISMDILNSRILQFFIHLFYFVPVIYYLARPSIQYSKGIEAKQIFKGVRKVLDAYYPKFEQVFTFIISLLLIIYNIYPLILQWTA